MAFFGMKARGSVMKMTKDQEESEGAIHVDLHRALLGKAPEDLRQEYGMFGDSQ